jgi:aldehyde:ferredoxin oxidoreductase
MQLACLKFSSVSRQPVGENCHHCPLHCSLHHRKALNSIQLLLPVEYKIFNYHNGLTAFHDAFDLIFKTMALLL